MILHIAITNPTDLLKQPGSWLIRKIDKSPGSHVSVILETYAGTKVYEAVWPRVRKLSHAEWSKHNKMVQSFSFEVPEHRQFEIFEYLEKQIGKRYSVPQLILIALDYIWPRDYKSLNGHHRLICSELAVNVLFKLFNISLNETTDTVGVLDIVHLCVSLKSYGIET